MSFRLSLVCAALVLGLPGVVWAAPSAPQTQEQADMLLETALNRKAKLMKRWSALRLVAASPFADEIMMEAALSTGEAPLRSTAAHWLLDHRRNSRAYDRQLEMFLASPHVEIQDVALQALMDASMSTRNLRAHAMRAGLDLRSTRRLVRRYNLRQTRQRGQGAGKVAAAPF